MPSVYNPRKAAALITFGRWDGNGRLERTGHKQEPHNLRQAVRFKKPKTIEDCGLTLLFAS